MLSVIATTGEVAGPNLYIDTVLQNVRKVLQDEGFEYLTIPDTTIGNVFLCDGQISGLASIRRKGEARMDNDKDGVSIEAKLQLQQVRLSYDYAAKVLFTKHKGEFSVCAGEIETFIKVNQTHDLNKSPILQEFVIRQLRGLRANHSGLGPVSWIMNRLQRTLLNRFHVQIQEFLGEKVHALLQEELNKFSLSEFSMMDLIAWQQSVGQSHNLG